MREIRVFSALVLQAGMEIELDDNAHRHVARVLRLAVGDALTLFNGDGFDYVGEIGFCDRRTTRVRILSREVLGNESPLHLTLFAALLKGEAMDRVMQKAVELGVSRIVPVAAARSEALPAGERRDKKLAHWQGVIVASAMQCGRAVLPALDEITPLAAVLDAADGLRWIFSPHHAPTADAPASADHLSLLIGPEGGFTPDEVAAAQSAGWFIQRLGPRILRADTAATVAIARAQSRYGDLSR
ncbi:16S rRNA (uracil(1498)-N(3))-methyltransferase [uncultured Cardiobacterium sp.]|uniref:16S rRNA (uracil(1498)-N(3))-methyltransferase n=1 Tax=uncultured Cardiobacterium sp. TaxID=417619 RepID=UPI002604350B|nr:16S rRNA (uracil(1498)-N(3))-methyltransferase [uncultured Cardiobacterium sp.]